MLAKTALPNGTPASRHTVPGKRKKRAGPETGPIFWRPAAEAAEPYLPAGAGAVGDFHAPVLRLADTVGGLDQRTAFAERLGRDHTVRNAVTGEVRTGVVGTTLRQADIIVC